VTRLKITKGVRLCGNFGVNSAERKDPKKSSQVLFLRDKRTGSMGSNNGTHREVKEKGAGCDKKKGESRVGASKGR